MGEDIQSRRRLIAVVVGLNLLAWGGYFYLTKVMGFDLESLRAVR